MIVSVLDRMENTAEKGESASYQHFLLFPQWFKGFPFKDVECGDSVIKG